MSCSLCPGWDEEVPPCFLGKGKLRLLKQVFHGVMTFTLSSALVSCAECDPCLAVLMGAEEKGLLLLRQPEMSHEHPDFHGFYSILISPEL